MELFSDIVCSKYKFGVIWVQSYTYGSILSICFDELLYEYLTFAILMLKESL